MKFHPKTIIFLNCSKISTVRAFQWIFCFHSQDGHLKTWFGNTKNTMPYYDVIKKHINEDIQKTLARSHCQTVEKMFISIIIPTSLWTKTEFICIQFHRTLSEGQEIDIRSIIFTRCHLKSYDWIFLF